MRGLAFGLALLPQVAAAFSCAPIDLQREFLDAQRSDRIFVIVMGQITLDPTDYAVRLSEDGTEEWLYPARFSGASLGRDGFRFGLDTDLVVSVCQGEWCVGPPGASERIYFLETTEEGYVYYPQICTADHSATPENRRILEDCMAGNICVSAY